VLTGYRHAVYSVVAAANIGVDTGEATVAGICGVTANRPNDKNYCTKNIPIDQPTRGTKNSMTDTTDLTTRIIDDSLHTVPTVPSLFVFNSVSMAKAHAIEHLKTVLIGYSIDAAIISETHFKKHHSSDIFNINNFALFRLDRAGRRAGGVAVWARSSLQPTLWSFPDPTGNYELL